MSDPLMLTVRERRMVDRTVILDLARRDGGPLPAWAPGAHIDLVLESDVIRQYSLCGDAADTSTWRIAVLREDHGRGGSALVHDRLLPGTEVPTKGPRNNFELRPAAKYVFIGGGIGVTPLLPMVRQAERSGLDWAIWYGGRSASSLVFADELSDYPPHRVHLRAEDAVGPLPLDEIFSSVGAGTVVYCCGPSGLLDAVTDHARRTGAELRIERFAAGGVENADDVEFEIELAQSGQTLPVPAGCSIVEVLAGAGITVDTSCGEGTCGTCETELLDGIPDHRDAILDADETESIMPCVSRARSPRLVLDL